MTYVIGEACVDVKDKTCIEECPVDCIYEGARMLYIHPDECVDCGACEPICPVEAIRYEDEVPQEWSAYIAVNSEFSPRSARRGAPPQSGSSRTTQRSPPCRPLWSDCTDPATMRSTG